jgi:N-acetylneuraminic acid mutarotase
MQLGLRRSLQFALVLLPVLLAASFALQRSVASEPYHSDHTHEWNGIREYGARPAENVEKGARFKSYLLAPASDVGQWSPLYNWPLVAVHGTLLPNGKILMWDVEQNSTTTARVWDPATNVFTAVPLYPTSLFCSAHLVMPDGRVFLNGGHFMQNKYGTRFTHIFNPSNNTWTRMADMAYARWYPTSLMLANGKIITFGGSITPTQNAVIPELYDPATNTWTQFTNSPNDVGLYPKVHIMPDGRIYVVRAVDWGSYIFDMSNGSWTRLSKTPNYFTSISYAPGRLLFIGKGTGAATTDLNVSTPSWTNVAPMAYPRYNPNMIVLPDGNVLVIGGSADGTNNPATAIMMPEMWNPTTQTWRQLTPMQHPRMYHSMGILLPDGRVLSAGGGHSTDSPADYFSAEIYSPPYLFRGARPTISSAPTATNTGATITVGTPDAANIKSVVFIRQPSLTHALNMGQSFLPATFTKNTNSLTVSVPSNPNLMPPGYYMLFILNNNDVPSVARIVSIGWSGGGSPPPTATPRPTNTPTPVPPSATPTATPNGGTNASFQVSAISNDVNEVNGELQASNYVVWLGTGASTTTSYTGLRFTGVSIPRGATIVSAQLQVYSPTSSSLSISLQIAGDRAANSAAFSASSRPSQRTLTSARVNYNSSASWSANLWYTVADVSSIVQEIVQQSTWASGNSLSLVLHGTGQANAFRYIAANEAINYYGDGVNRAARLVINYR